MARGLLISFEGGEAVGKSTQIQLLKKVLESYGFNVLVTREPGGTPVGEKIRSLIKTKEMSLTTEVLLMEAARRELCETVLKPALAKNTIILCDRFQESTLVYQAFVKGFPLKEAEKLNQLATSGVKPDRIFLLDLEPRVLRQRLKSRKRFDRFDSQGFKFHKKVREGFLKMAKRINKTSKRKNSVVVLDANQTKRDLHEQIVEEVEPLLKRLRRRR